MPAPYISPAPESFKQVDADAGSLSWLFVLSVAAADRWLFIFDGTSSAGTLIGGPFKIPAGSDRVIDFNDELPGGRSHERPDFEYTTGLYLASSSSASPFVAAGGADFRFNVKTRAP